MVASKLWLPDSAKELLSVELNEANSASEEEFQAMVFINQCFTDWLNGKLDTGILTDILLEYGVAPETIDNCEDYIQILHRLGDKVN